MADKKTLRLRELMDDDAHYFAALAGRTDDMCCGDCPAFAACEYDESLVEAGWGLCAQLGTVDAVSADWALCELAVEEIGDVAARVAALNALEAAEAEFDARSGR